MNDIDAVDLQVKNQKSEVMKEYQQKQRQAILKDEERGKLGASGMVD